LDIPDAAVFEAEMWGYGGLHAVRRLAAYISLENALPPPGQYEEFSNDPVLARHYALLDQWYVKSSRTGWMGRFAQARAKPPFQHLLWHSDCEGFYLPRRFEDVVLDKANPQRAGLGAMVGSASMLLDECESLANSLALPAGLDPDSDEVLDAAENPVADGPIWKRFGVESFGVLRLIEGCRSSLSNNAALVFG
jgi:hypothetical protein